MGPWPNRWAEPLVQSEEHQLRRLKWIAILGPLIFLTALELIRNLAGSDILRAWPGYVLMAGVVLIAALFFAEAIFGVIGRMQQRLRRQNRELIALHEAGISITGELDLELVLQRVVDGARELGGARYGALSLLREAGGIEAFITSGISTEERRRIGPIPEGHGLLSTVIAEGDALRTPDLTADPRSVGFPEHHPPMRSLLAVPVASHGRILGSFYLTEKVGASQFSEDDQRRLVRFATQAAIAIENARLHRQVQALAVAEERDRIAREMHDTVAQVLGYVNTKAQAAQEHLNQNQVDRASDQISQLAVAARQAYSDVREDILGLRTSVDSDRDLLHALSEYLQAWSHQSGIEPSLTVSPDEIEQIDLTPIAELQLLRIIQESLSNVRKHARASKVDITICQATINVHVTISDNGVGFVAGETVPHEFPRFGLATMQERAESVDGRFEVSGCPGKGTTVSVTIPRAGSTRR